MLDNKYIFNSTSGKWYYGFGLWTFDKKWAATFSKDQAESILKAQKKRWPNDSLIIV